MCHPAPAIYNRAADAPEVLPYDWVFETGRQALLEDGSEDEDDRRFEDVDKVVADFDGHEDALFDELEGDWLVSPVKSTKRKR